MNYQQFAYLNHNNNHSHNNLLIYPSYPIYQTYPLYFNTQLLYYPYNGINSIINPDFNPRFTMYRPYPPQYYKGKYHSTGIKSIADTKTKTNPRLNPIKPNYKHQTKKPQQKINKKTDLNEIFQIIYKSGFLSSMYAIEEVYDNLKNNYDLNGDDNFYKKSNIYKILHNTSIKNITYGTIDYNITLKDKLRILEVLIKLGAKVDYKTTYFEDSILYDFMKIIEDYKLNIDYYYKYRNNFYQSYVDDELKNNNLYVEQYLRILSLLLSKSIQTKFKTDSKHTLTPLDYARKLHIDYFIVKFLK